MVLGSIDYEALNTIIEGVAFSYHTCQIAYMVGVRGPGLPDVCRDKGRVISHAWASPSRQILQWTV